MDRLLAATLGLWMLAAATGCTMCGSEFDRHYAAFGGAWDRHDREHGRVGSAFYSGGERVKYGETRTPDETPEVVDDVPEDEAMEGPDTTDQGSG